MSSTVPGRLISSAWKRASSYIRYSSIYRSFREYTMVPQGMFVDNLRVAALVADVPGCVVECGVWKGGMSAGIASLLGARRNYFLFDSFEGLPPAQPIDGEKAIAWQNSPESPAYYENCSAGEEYARRAMAKAGASAARLVRGWFSDTVPPFVPPEPIAFLRLDGDWYESTMVCLTHLYDKVTPGGVIVLDDYYSWDGCSRATHDFLSKRSAVERIRVQGSVCYLIKAAEESNATH